MKTLIVYDSKTGCTEDCAKYIAQKIENCDLLYLRSNNVRDLNEYEQIIIGSPIYVSNPSSKTKKFYQENIEVLLQKEVKLYFCGGSEGFEEMQDTVFQAIGDSLKNHATQISYFGGELRLDRMKFFTRLFIKAIERAKKTDVKPSIKYDVIDQFIEG